MDRWKSRGGKSQRRERKRKEDQGALKVENSRKTARYQPFCCSGQLKSRLAKVAGAEPSGQIRDEQLPAVVARGTFRTQNAQKIEKNTIFGGSSVVARSTLRSQNGQNYCWSRTTFGS